MSGKAVDVRIVPQGKDWAVKLTGRYGNKPIKVTSSLAEAQETAKWVAAKHEVPILTYDAAGALVGQEPWAKGHKWGRKR